MTVWAWIGLIVAGLAGVILLGLLLLGRGRGLPSWRAARLARVWRLSARVSASWLGSRVRRLFAGAQRRARIDADQRAANAKRVAETMGNMKGAFMKLGQMVSFISDDIPDEYRTMLATLQASAPAMDFAIIRDVVESELGKPLERAFAHVSAEPLASASIGQVHRATLPNGDEVVVKVQYPGVAEAIRGDLQNVAVLYRMIALMYPTLEPAGVVAELQERIGEELDYRLEARNQSAFHDLYRGHPFIRVPRVIPEYSTGKILTSEFVAGKRFAEVAEGDQAERDRYGEILYRFVFGSIIRFRAFNGDPHPGNYLFDGDGKMVFLDFGCTKYFPDPMMGDWKKLLEAHLAGDKAAFRGQVVALRFIPADSDLPADKLYEYFGYFYEPFRNDRSFTFTREYNRQSFKMVFRPDGDFAGFHRKMNMPRDFVFVNRIQWGVFSILGILNATGNWHRIEREFLFGEAPSTPMGEAIATWRAGWLREHGHGGRDVHLTPDGLVGAPADRRLTA